MKRIAVVLGSLVVLASLVVVIWLEYPAEPDPPHRAQFVGSARCADCHAEEYRAWQGSQHAKAMQPATAATVLGDFSGAQFSHAGVTSTFFTREGRYVVRTDGPDGQLADLEVKYTFGIEPLQQYLIELPGGRLQALSINWDTRPSTQGGQRWFHLYPNERVDHRDELHWTQPAQNWNTQCADCHSTNIAKGFDATTSTFSTTWSEVSVGCEACHGPGSNHLRSPEVPYPEPALSDMASCAACHSRRAQFAEGAVAGDALLEHYLPTTLSEGLYHPDGQQQGEVFVWGSYLQSKKYLAGVTCAACHEPHTQQLKQPGNASCTQCHAAEQFETPVHHRHEKDPPQCVSCHMRQETYMVIDRRRDHGFHIPRPDLSIELGVPNACSDCHADRDARWADNAMATWYGATYRDRPHFGEALHAGRRGDAGAVSKLLTLLDTPVQPAIVRATALELLARYPGSVSTSAIRRHLADADPLVRHQAVLAESRAADARQVERLTPLLADPVRAVRHEAARQLAGRRARLAAPEQARLDAEVADLETSLRHDLSRGQAWLNLATLQGVRGQAEAAEQSLRRAMAVEPRFVPAYVNLADLLRGSAREAQAEAVLRQGLQVDASSPVLREALGLSLVRQARKPEALKEFLAAHRAAPDDPRFRYVYALALDDTGRRDEARRVLEAGLTRRFDRDALLALASWARSAGDAVAERRALERLRAVNPADPALPGSGR